MNIENALQEYGLKPNEIKVYLASFSETPISAQKIANKTGIVRQIVYDTLRELIDKGIIQIIYEGKTKKYQATEGKHLITLLHEKENRVKEILPQLKEIRKNKEINSKTSLHYGIKGLHYLFNLALESKSSLKILANYHVAHEIFRDFDFYSYTVKRIEKRIPLKQLVNPIKMDNKEREVWKTDKKSLRETRFSEEIVAMPSTFIIFDDKVIIFNMSRNEPLGLLIEDVLINKSHNILFDFIWKRAKIYT